MNKLLLLLFTTWFSIGFAQKIHLGPELGINMIQIEKTDLGKDFQPGWYSGIAFEYDFYDFFAIKTGVYYSQKRQSYGSADTSEWALLSLLGGIEIPFVDFSTYKRVEGRVSQNYIEIPLLAQYKYKGLSAYFGPYFSFMFAARSKQVTYTSSPFTQAIDFSSLDSTGFLTSFLPPEYNEELSESSSQTGYRIFDYGGKAGVGYENHHVGIHASYNFGIPDYRVNKGEAKLQNHQYFQVSVNYLFGIGKNSTGQSRL